MVKGRCQDCEHWAIETGQRHRNWGTVFYEPGCEPGRLRYCEIPPMAECRCMPPQIVTGYRGERSEEFPVTRYLDGCGQFSPWRGD